MGMTESDNILLLVVIRRKWLPCFNLFSSGEFELSLNGKGALDNDQALCNQGIVNGDLLFVLRDEPTELSTESVTQKVCKKAPEKATTSHSVCSVGATKDLSVQQMKPESSVQQTAGASGVVAMDTEGHHLATVAVKAASSCGGGALVSGGQYDEFVEGRVEVQPEATSFEILCVVLHSLMLDYGFAVDTTEVQLSSYFDVYT